jgi:quinol-cytochrome oxidoreductase complex cytochrome b subunit
MEKTNNNNMTLVVCIILIISGAFYWFQYRPSEIKKECVQYGVPVATYDVLYQNCLHEHGL